MQCSAIVAAAGLSSRMRDFKPMLCLGEETIISRMIRSLREAGVGEIVVVTGYRADTLSAHLEKLHVQCVENRDYAKTKMFDSLLLGLDTLQEPCDAVILTPGDVPLVRPETIRLLLNSGGKAAYPTYEGKPGHPVMLEREMVDEIRRYDGGDGLRGALAHLSVESVQVPVHDEGILLGADTPDDFRTLLRQDMANHSSGRLWPDIRIQIAKNDVILKPETAQYIEMIEHTGSIQNACACMHMSYSKGWRLINRMETELGYPLVVRSSGGVGGGGTTLTGKGKRLLQAYQNYRDQVKVAANQLFTEIFPCDLNA